MLWSVSWIWSTVLQAVQIVKLQDKFISGRREKKKDFGTWKTGGGFFSLYIWNIYVLFLGLLSPRFPETNPSN